MRTITEYTDDELAALIHNHERRGQTAVARYIEAVEVLALRRAPRLNIDRTRAAILAAARESRFLSYGDVAAANGLAWSFDIHHRMPGHLDVVLAKAHAEGQPLITSIVVNASNVKTGDLEETSLAGFIAGARRLGYQISDPLKFLREQQDRTFSSVGGSRPNRGGPRC